MSPTETVLMVMDAETFAARVAPTASAKARALVVEFMLPLIVCGCLSNRFSSVREHNDDP
jgi:hypothetical protein